MDFPLGDVVRDYVARIEMRPAVQAALARERSQSDPGCGRQA
jgi:hypothetical protein